MKLVHIDSLKRGMIVGQEVPPYEKGGVPLIRVGVSLTSELITTLHRHEIKYLFIDEIATKNREKQLEMLYRKPLVPVAKPIVTPVLRENAISGLRNLFDSVAIGAEDIHSSSLIVQQLDKVVTELVDVLLRDKRTIININGLKSYDEYTYHHSLSVAVLSIAIGQYLRFDRKELSRLGMCAIMHDIGKTSVPVEVINKSSRLSDGEFALIKTHSPEGYQYLLKTAIGDDDIRAGVLSHHEKLDGTGYPFGIKGDNIPLWSRIISVADVYDALTSNRPYRLPLQPAEALEYIMGGIGSSFDYDIVSAFVKKVELYPVGSNVALSDGTSATVLNTNTPMRPVVKLLETGDVIDLSSDRQYLNVVVSCLLPDAPAPA